MRRILSIDGGGIKGVVPASFLATLEAGTSSRIVDHFDLIVGTSTGGIIALGLGLGLSASEILNFYEEHGPAIFDQEPGRKMPRRWLRSFHRSVKGLTGPRYEATSLRASLTEVFGERTLGESTTRLVIPAFDRTRGVVYLFKTAHHARLKTDWQEKAVEVALATAAAPTYLPEHRLPTGVCVLDGGVWANNPTGLAVVEAVGLLGWDPRELRVLSLGCSQEPAAVPRNPGWPRAAMNVAEFFMRGQDSASMGTARVLLGVDDEHQRLHRYQPVSARGAFGLDRVKAVADLRAVGRSLGREALSRVGPFFLQEPREDFAPVYPGGALS